MLPVLRPTQYVPAKTATSALTRAYDWPFYQIKISKLLSQNFSPAFVLVSEPKRDLGVVIRRNSLSGG